MQYYPTRQLFDEGVIPSSFRGQIPEDCSYCSFPMIMNVELTFRKCSNPRCPEHMSQKADRMFKYLGYKNIGPATCKLLIQVHNPDTHLDLVPIVTEGYKPKLHLYEIAKLLFIDGLQDALEKELGKYGSFEEYFSKKEGLPQLVALKRILISSEKYFDIKDPLPPDVIEIMITGSISGSTQDVYVATLNHILKGYLHVKEVGLKNSAYACITENKSSSSRKAKLARGELRSNVSMKMYTPKEFIFICSKLAEHFDTLREKAEEL